MENDTQASVSQVHAAHTSRRQALGTVLGACGWLPRVRADNGAAAPVRLAISESLVADVNLTDARAAMLIWINRMQAAFDLAVELNPKVFESTEEIFRRARAGLFDAVALNVVEFRQIADYLDASQIVAEGGAEGMEQYVMVAKRSGGFRQLADLRKRRLSVLKAPKMCVANAWLTTLLEREHLGLPGQFFGAVTTDVKASQVVLPVFFGQADACVTSREGFDTMCELNPQVGKDLAIIASSPSMVVTLYTLHKNYHGGERERFLAVYGDVLKNPAGRQLATLFQFQELVRKGSDCLTPALAILDAADRARRGRGMGARE